jgi:uncharacterized protein (DUF433 family)
MKEDWRGRIAVEFVLELLTEGWTIEEALRNYPLS